MRFTGSWRSVVVITAALALAASPQAWAQSTGSSTTGKLKTKVTDALKSIANGKCPENLMSIMLLDQCEQQLERMQSHFATLGGIKEVNYRGVEATPMGEAEVYRVVFVKGSMQWLAAAGPNGKLNVLWSPG
jgi:hypothetical protein